MKGITPIIAIIVLLLITVALAGATWTYLSDYFNRMIAKQIELTDSFCINGNQAVIFVRNMGTQSFSPSSEITVMNASSGTNVAVNWSTADGTALGAGNLEPGKIGRVNTTCPSGTLCVYRVTSSSTGRSIRASVQC
jgi:flagellin-like protein